MPAGGTLNRIEQALMGSKLDIACLDDRDRDRAAQGTALALAVQPLDTWREMWVFRQSADGWHAEVVPPALDAAGLGYVEFAGWVPGGTEMLAARETRGDDGPRAAGGAG